MTADFHLEEGPSETAKPRGSRDWTAFNRRWTAFIFSCSLVIGLVLVYKTMVSIYQDFDVELPLLTIVVLHPYTIWCLSLIPVAVIAKEFAPITLAQKQFLDSATINLSLVFGLISAWALFRPLIILIQGLDG